MVEEEGKIQAGREEWQGARVNLCKQQIPIDRSVSTRAVADGASRNDLDLPHLLMRAGGDQFGSGLQLSLDSGQPWSYSVLPACRRGSID